jgi:hypothetical protein
MQLQKIFATVCTALAFLAFAAPMRRSWPAMANTPWA